MEKVPFKYGEVVTNNYFTNRETEIKRLHSNFMSCQNTIIISPRRYGKTSLVKEAINRFSAKKNYLFCTLDLMTVYNEEEFFNKFASAVMQSTATKIEEFARSIKKFLSSARISFSTGIESDPSIELGVNFINENKEHLINIAQVVAKDKKKKIVICIDGFQGISKFKNSEQIQGRLRAAWQQHTDVCYVLYGSKKTMMSEMFQKQNMPFYKFGDTMFLERIIPKELIKYIQTAFTKTEKYISKELSNKVIDITENHPYYTQQLASIVWQLSDESATEDDIAEAKKIILADNLNYANEILDNLTGYQSNFLRAILSGEEKFYSVDVLNRYKLGTSANIKKLSKALQMRDVITKEKGKIEIIDPIFKIIAKKILL